MLKYDVMGKKEVNLKKMFKIIKQPRLSLEELKSSSFYEDAYNMYKRLGGQLDDIPCNYRWDITTRDFIIELDEERHFNRYRQETLNSPIYLNYKGFSIDKYKQYCTQHEPDCLSAAWWGKNWKNDSTEKMFLKSGPLQDLSGNGSSRWRQRAFYDYLRDITSLIKGIPVIRVSIYDNYKGMYVQDLLTSNDQKVIKSFITDLLNGHGIKTY